MGKYEKHQIAEYLADLQPLQRQRVEQLRDRLATIIEPEDFVIWYQIPTFIKNGKPFLSLGGWKSHYSIYLLSGTLGAKIADRLDNGRNIMSVVKFDLDSEPTDKELRMIVQAKKESLERP